MIRVTKVLGIDPGIASSGWAIVQLGLNRPTCLLSGVWETAPDPDWRARISEISKQFVTMLCDYEFDVVSAETFTYQGERSYAANLIRIPRLIQNLADQCESRGIPFIEVTTTEAKSAIGLRGKCDKARVRRTLEGMLDGSWPRTNHARDAVVSAIAGERKYRRLMLEGKVA